MNNASERNVGSRWSVMPPTWLARVGLALVILLGITALAVQPAAAAGAPIGTAVGTSTVIQVTSDDYCEYFVDQWGSSGAQGFARIRCHSSTYTWFRAWGRCSAPWGTYSRPGSWQRENERYWSVVYCDWGHRMISVSAEESR